MNRDYPNKKSSPRSMRPNPGPDLYPDSDQDQDLDEELKNIESSIKDLEQRRKTLLEGTYNYIVASKILRKIEELYEIVEPQDKDTVNDYIMTILNSSYKNMKAFPFECCICKVSKPPLQRALLKCGHNSFCRSCVEEIQFKSEDDDVQPKCPLCRAPFTDEDIY